MPGNTNIVGFLEKQYDCAMSQTFTITKETPIGRLGKIESSNGCIETPAFIFCATKGAIKGATTRTMSENGTQAILGNTYNLMDFPGGEFIEASGGLHKMMRWDGPMWTDSGGFQVFSLGYGSVSQEIKGKRNSPVCRVKISEEGIMFKSPRDGLLKKLTPESSIQIQNQIGSNFTFVLDQCTPFHMTKIDVANAMRQSHRWEIRSLEEHRRIGSKQGLYGIVQGGVYPDLRKESIDFVNSMPFFGHGIGGSLGANQDDMMRILDLCNQGLDKSRPKHLLGIGKMSDIIEAVKYNIDTFDCVHPTRIARHGGALVSQEHWVKTDYGFKEHISITNSQFKNDYGPIDEKCGCNVCRDYNRSYIHYLFAAKEILGIILLVEHNVFFMNQFMKNLRFSIKLAVT